MGAERYEWSVISDVAGFLLTTESLADAALVTKALGGLRTCKCPPESHWLGAGHCFAFLIEEGIEHIGVFARTIGLDEDFGIFEGRHYMNARFRGDASKTPAQAVCANMQILQDQFKKATTEEKFRQALSSWNQYRDYLGRAFETSTRLSLPQPMSRNRFREQAKQQWIAALLFGSGSFTATLSHAFASHDVDERPGLPTAREPERGPSQFGLGSEHGFVAVAKAVARTTLATHPCQKALRNALARVRRYNDFGEDADRRIARLDRRWSLMALSAAPEGWHAQFRKLRDDDLLIQLVSPMGPPPDWSVGEIFRQRPVRTVVSGSSSGWRFLEPVLVGLGEVQKDDEVEVVRLRHRENGGHAYSYGFYMPCGGAISNAGEFWLYHSVSADHGSARVVEMLIQAALRRLPSRVVLREYDVDEDKLQRFIVSKPLAILAARQKRADDRLADLRGSLGELAVGELLRREGWPSAETRRLQSLDEPIDCVATDPENNRALLVEVKATLVGGRGDYGVMEGGSLDNPRQKDAPRTLGLWRDDGSITQIQRIERKFRNANRAVLAKELGLRDGASIEMQVFVLGELRGDAAGRIASPVVTPEQFIARCKEAEVPKNHYTAIRLMRDVDADADERRGRRLFDEFLLFRHRDSWT